MSFVEALFFNFLMEFIYTIFRLCTNNLGWDLAGVSIESPKKSLGNLEDKNIIVGLLLYFIKLDILAILDLLL